MIKYLVFLFIILTSLGIATHNVMKQSKTIKFVFYDNAIPTLQDSLMHKVSRFYKVLTYKDVVQKLPKTAYYAPRNRYRAGVLLENLKLKKDTFYKVIGFTDKDISTTKGAIYDHGIFGMGYCPGESAVVSSYRTGQRLDRLTHILLHEVGHTYGLPHCSTSGCFMEDAKGKMVHPNEKLCINCQIKLKKLYEKF